MARCFTIRGTFICYELAATQGSCVRAYISITDIDELIDTVSSAMVLNNDFYPFSAPQSSTISRTIPEKVASSVAPIARVRQHVDRGRPRSTGRLRHCRRQRIIVGVVVVNYCHAHLLINIRRRGCAESNRGNGLGSTSPYFVGN